VMSRLILRPVETLTTAERAELLQIALWTEEALADAGFSPFLFLSEESCPHEIPIT
jgi:hypothetical protein